MRSIRKPSQTGTISIQSKTNQAAHHSLTRPAPQSPGARQALAPQLCQAGAPPHPQKPVHRLGSRGPPPPQHPPTPPHPLPAAPPLLLLAAAQVLPAPAQPPSPAAARCLLGWQAARHQPLWLPLRHQPELAQPLWPQPAQPPPHPLGRWLLPPLLRPPPPLIAAPWLPQALLPGLAQHLRPCRTLVQPPGWGPLPAHLPAHLARLAAAQGRVA